MDAITVLIAEDHMIVREAIRCLLELGGKIKVIGEAKNGREAVQLTQELHPDVVLMDIAMPELNGIEATQQILKDNPEARVLMLSAYENDAYVDQAIAVGASGYLIKQDSIQIITRAIRDVNQGKRAYSASIARRLESRSLKPNGHSGKLKTKPGKLSRRETETLQMIAEGRANKQIAGDLGVSIKTVEKHRHNLMEKLNIHDTASLTRYAIFTRVIEDGRSENSLPARVREQPTAVA